MDRSFVEQVYETMWGQLIDKYAVPGVEDAFCEGSRCGQLYEQMLEAYERVCDRSGVADEDPDVETIVGALLEMDRILCLKMFGYGEKMGREGRS
ncbi:MAG: hypothetical protein IIV61_03350 [Oscillospiraceae bacterium]|nr:hypothetical protein [Oscillospiraceae bacterium]